jgi:hypothetical protein
LKAKARLEEFTHHLGTLGQEKTLRQALLLEVQRFDFFHSSLG